MRGQLVENPIQACILILRQRIEDCRRIRVAVGAVTGGYFNWWQIAFLLAVGLGRIRRCC
jgi:hypothetical protein